MKTTHHHLAHPKYRPDIDGLRAIAVLSVVGFHYFPGRIPGGFVGVDVFFVISGFLISTIIFENLGNDRFSYVEFYARRIKRIFPALLLVLISTMAFGWYVLFPDEFVQLGKHVAGGAGFASNLVSWSETGYFDGSAATKPLLHLWSLGIEEQFYIVWPLLLGLMWRRDRNFLFLTFSVAILSFAINIYWIDRDPVALFFSPFSRAWELMAGGLLAYVMLHRRNKPLGNSKLRSSLAPFGLVQIGISVILFTKNTPFPGWWALLPIVGASFVIAGQPEAWVSRHFLGHPAMVWIGLISYPLYLWHWPLLAFARILEEDTPARTIRVLLVVASILLASATYVLVEKRFKKDYSKAAISYLSFTMVILLVIGLTTWKGTPLPRLSSKSLAIVVDAVEDWDYPGGLVPVSRDEETLLTAAGSKTKTLFFGDSHMEQYAPRIVRLLEENPDKNTAIFATHAACPPIPNVHESMRPWCPEFVNETIQYMDRQDVEVVVIGARWNLYFLTATRESADQETNEFSYYYTGDNDEKHMFNGGGGASMAIQELELFLSKIARNKRVYLLLDNPSGNAYSPKTFLEGLRLTQLRSTLVPGKESDANYDPEQRQLRDELKALAMRAGAMVIDPSARLCTGQRCKVSTEEGIPIYKDNDHLRPFYVEQFADYLDATLNQSPSPPR